jgi:putative PIN family toxin of toxin-antitoxin system
MPGDERLVVDTNVVLSGLLFPGSIPSRALLKAQTCTILASETTRLELVEVMERSRFDRYVEREVRQRLADEYGKACEMVEILFPIHACRDPKDDKFLEVAVHGLADLILTGDRDLLDLHPFHGIAILTPAEYLERK